MNLCIHGQKIIGLWIIHFRYKLSRTRQIETITIFSFFRPSIFLFQKIFSSPIFFFFHQFKIQIFSSLSAIRNEFINIRKKRRSIESLRIIIRVKINRAPLCPFCVASSGTRTNSRVQLERNAYITIPYITFRFYKFISLPQPYPENQSSNFLIVSNLSR